MPSVVSRVVTPTRTGEPESYPTRAERTSGDLAGVITHPPRATNGNAVSANDRRHGARFDRE